MTQAIVVQIARRHRSHAREDAPLPLRRPATAQSAHGRECTTCPHSTFTHAASVPAVERVGRVGRRPVRRRLDRLLARGHAQASTQSAVRRRFSVSFASLIHANYAPSLQMTTASGSASHCSSRTCSRIESQGHEVFLGQLRRDDRRTA